MTEDDKLKEKKITHTKVYLVYSSGSGICKSTLVVSVRAVLPHVTCHGRRWTDKRKLTLCTPVSQLQHKSLYEDSQKTLPPKPIMLGISV